MERNARHVVHALSLRACIVRQVPIEKHLCTADFSLSLGDCVLGVPCCEFPLFAPKSYEQHGGKYPKCSHPPTKTKEEILAAC